LRNELTETHADLLGDCVHCGFCLPTCPTYTLWHEEMDSPRGRIQLMVGLAEGTIAMTDTVVEHFDRCLGCMACVSSCPSGVQYDRLIETTRAQIESEHRRRGLDRVLRSAAFAVLPHRRRLRAALALRRLPAPWPLGRLKRIAPPWTSAAWPPEHLPGDGPRVALLAGCVQSVVFGDVNAATARVLQADGYDVHVPRAQGCCGALHAHAGRLDQGVAAARALERDLGGYDHIVTNAAGCGSHLKDHGIANVVDVSELLGEPRATRHPLAISVAFQDSCHLRHAQRITGEPRSMLDAIPGLARREPAGQEICCGSAGLYNVVQADAAAELGRRKAAAIVATGAEAYASANPGCLVQVSSALRAAGQPLPAFHPIELVDASIRGVSKDRLLAQARR
jgi:glycolate oxidase iron-sulfur subunit